MVHDWLNQMGGAERVLLTLGKLFPEAPVFTSIYAPNSVDSRFGAIDVRTSFMQRLPGVFAHYRWYLPIYPLAFNRLWLRGFDVVLSNASAFCKAVRTPPSTVHICYCLTPTRFVWNTAEYLAREPVSRPLRLGLAPLLGALRRWDRRMAGRVDRFVAISRAVAARIRAAYGRESEIIHPPVETRAFAPSSDVEDYFLVVSRLAPYKRIDLPVAACTRLGLNLKIIGSGRALESLRAAAGPSVEFLGRLDDVAVGRHLARCKALIFPGEEDFGIVPLEAQASGRPVIAYGAGGALETVLAGETGEFFGEPTVESLARVLSAFDHSRYAAASMIANARRFDESVFIQNIERLVDQAYAEHARGLSRKRTAGAQEGRTGRVRR